ncbi:MAG TPA: RagB/SusD family nutrient uptake outer membrane protein [Chitinophagaceae bacterium]|nr:RagB/SusD family nutrient uptake outer membrane protein [Chitinophagaceae bacterium]
MRTNYFSKICLVLLALPVLHACKKSFLDVDPVGLNLESNYYSNPTEAFAGLVAAYDPLGMETAGTYANKLGPLNSASDDCVAGGASGGNDMNTWQVWNNYTLTPAVGPQMEYWTRNFTGVSRTNIILSKLGDVPGLDENTKKRYIAEGKFLRAYYYFDLVRLFKNVPLFTAPVATEEIYNQVQAAPADVYAQIEKDLRDAIPDLPPTVPVTTEGGRATQGAAKALLGKVILFQNDNSRMMEAANLFEDVNKQDNIYGYKLMTNFGDIFRPDKKFNSESVFEIGHTSVANGNWNAWGAVEGNVYTQMIGPRAYTGTIYETGWGFNPVRKELADLLYGDPRYQYTVADIDSMVDAGAATSYEASYQNTGYFVQKFAPLKQWKSTGGGNVELNYPNNVIEIRLADTYLMEAEALLRAPGGDAVKAAKYLNDVRARVGLTPVAATLDNVALERRKELATEGHRWFDLVRTGKAATVLAFKGFVAGKHEILPIPLNELTNTKLVQNPNYN